MWSQSNINTKKKREKNKHYKLIEEQISNTNLQYVIDMHLRREYVYINHIIYI